jgi:hypothetical protein
MATGEKRYADRNFAIIEIVQFTDLLLVESVGYRYKNSVNFYLYFKLKS